MMNTTTTKTMITTIKNQKITPKTMYSQELNDYYDQNLPNPPTPAPIPPPPPPPMGKITFFLGILNMMKYRLFIVTLKYRVSYAKYLIKSFLKCLLF